MSNFTDYKLQITEMYQDSDNRRLQPICHMPSAAFLPHATCHLLNNSEGVA